MKVGICLHSLYWNGKKKWRNETVEDNPVMYPATYYGYPTLPAYPINSGYAAYNIPLYSPRVRDTSSEDELQGF